MFSHLWIFCTRRNCWRGNKNTLMSISVGFGPYLAVETWKKTYLKTKGTDRRCLFPAYVLIFTFDNFN